MSILEPIHCTPRLHRTLFLSDLHLGALGCRSDLILEFLRTNRAETYVLVGDVMDLWHPLVLHWTARDQAVIDHLRECHAEGAELVYLVGNHDRDPARAPRRCRLPATPVSEHIHHAGDGRRYLLLHGDVADGRLLQAHVMTRIGSRIDNALRRLDGWLHRWRRRSRADARNPMARLIIAVNALIYRGHRHEVQMVELARERGLDGVICGHFHIADLHERHGLTYANCGDWMDSFTALAEDHQGRLSLLCGRTQAARALGPLPMPRPMPSPVPGPVPSPVPVAARV